MENKSEELCKLLGIEPKTIQTILSCSECRYKTIDNCPDTEEAECPEQLEYIYPDLTKPSNFVKLLEIVAEISTLSIKWNGSRYYSSIHYFLENVGLSPEGNMQEAFIETLIYANSKNGCMPKMLDKMQLIAQQTDWEY